MADINFDCPHCGHNLEVSERGAGLTVACPECAKSIVIPIPAPQLVENDILFNCGSCDHPLKGSSDMAGQLIDCPACEKPTEIPFASHPSPFTPTRPTAGGTPVLKPPSQRQVPGTGTSTLPTRKTEEGRICTGTRNTIGETAEQLVNQNVINYLTAARTAVDREDWVESDRFYSLAQQNQPDNWESIYFGAYSRARLSLLDPDVFKREHCFNVLMKSLVCVRDKYRPNTDLIETRDIFNRIRDSILKMTHTTIVYNNFYPQGARTYDDSYVTDALFRGLVSTFEEVLNALIKNEDQFFLIGELPWGGIQDR